MLRFRIQNDLAEARNDRIQLTVERLVGQCTDIAGIV
jgi:hypothetical protein